MVSGKKSDKNNTAPENETTIALGGDVTFTYIGTNDSTEYAGLIHYSDSYFDTPSTTYNVSMATSALCFAMSCGNSPRGFAYGYINAEKLLGNLGYRNIGHNDAYENEPTDETVGVIIGSKMINGKTTLLMGIRGIGYRSEWGGNLKVGTGKYHEGFAHARDLALEYLRKYISDNNITGDIRLLVTGYSRSATSNLVAGKIDGFIAEGRISELLGAGIRLDRESMYGYCFEPAETVDSGAFDIHGPDYSNIWNIINPNDPVPIVVTSSLGMERFGTDVKLPCCSDRFYERKCNSMLKYYDALSNREALGEYTGDSFSVVKPPDIFIEDPSVLKWKNQSTFLVCVNETFVSYLGSRGNYTDNMQDGLSKIIAERMSFTDKVEFRNNILKALGDNKLDLVKSLRNLRKGDREALAISLRNPVLDALRASGASLMLVDVLCDSVAKALLVFREFISENRLMFFNFVMNAKTIGFAHYPELIFAWMCSLDPNYR